MANATAPGSRHLRPARTTRRVQQCNRQRDRPGVASSASGSAAHRDYATAPGSRLLCFPPTTRPPRGRGQLSEVRAQYRQRDRPRVPTFFQTGARSCPRSCDSSARPSGDRDTCGTLTRDRPRRLQGARVESPQPLRGRDHTPSMRAAVPWLRRNGPLKRNRPERCDLWIVASFASKPARPAPASRRVLVGAPTSPRAQPRRRVATVIDPWCPRATAPGLRRVGARPRDRPGVAT